MTLQIKKISDTKATGTVTNESNDIIDSDNFTIAANWTNQQIEEFITNKFLARGDIDLTPIEWV